MLMESPKLTAILLAAGSSTRMGSENKLLLPYRGKVILQHLIDELAQAEIDDLIIVLGYENDLVKNKIPKQLRTVFNPDYTTGMTSSIQKGLSHANENHQGYMICLADQVMMQTVDYNQIIAAWKMQFQLDKKSIALPFYKKQKGNPVIFSSYYKNELLAEPAGNGCKAVVQKNKRHLLKVEMKNQHILVDIDTPVDYHLF